MPLVSIRRRQRKRIVVVTICAVLVLSVCYGLLRLLVPREPTAPADEAVASVNGEPILGSEVERTRQAGSGDDVLRRLEEERVVLQEAKQEQLELEDPGSLVQMDELNRHAISANDFPGQEQALKARLLLRALVLKHVTEDRRRRLYDIFHSELARYDVWVLQAPAAAQPGRHLGFRTLSQVRTRFGPAAAIALARLRVGQTSRPFLAPVGPMVWRLVGLQSSFAELRAPIDDMIVASDSLPLLNTLMTQANIKEHGAPVAVAMRPRPDPVHDIFSAPTAKPDGASTVFAPPESIPGINAGGVYEPAETTSDDDDSVFEPVPKSSIP